MPKSKATHKPTAFKQLADLVSTTEGGPLAVQYAKMLNPQFGFPDVLSKILWLHLSRQHRNKSVDEMCFVVRKAIERRTKNEDPISFLTTVAQSCPHRWRSEFVLYDLEMRLRCVLSSFERKMLLAHLNSLGDRMLDIFGHRLSATAGLFNDVTSLASLQQVKERIFDILKLLSMRMPLTEGEVEQLGQLTIGDWYFELKTKFWHNELNKGILPLTNEEHQEAVYIFLELENKKGHEYCRDLLAKLTSKSSSTDLLKTNYTFLKALRNCLASQGLEDVEGERNLDQIVSAIQSDANTSENLRQRMKNVSQNVQKA